MHTPGTPENEDERLQALLATGLLDTAPEERFDRLTRLAKRIFNTRSAVISLIGTERQWFKSRQSLDACETTRRISFCGHAILGRDILEVQDASKDPRFADTHGVRLALADHCGQARVSTDAGRFQQVMNNLLPNAVKFSPEGGEVRVEQMQGRIGFESAPGLGATFWFELPTSAANTHHAPGPASTGAPATGVSL